MSSSPVVIILAAYNVAERIWDFWTSNGNAIAFFLFVYLIVGAIFWEQDSVHECRGTESFNHYFFPGSVFSQLEIPEKGNFEGYFGSFIRCIYSFEPVLMWHCKLMVSRRYFSDYLWQFSYLWIVQSLPVPRFISTNKTDREDQTRISEISEDCYV